MKDDLMMYMKKENSAIMITNMSGIPNITDTQVFLHTVDTMLL